MSPKVRELPEDLIARIAAGEVVERPASVVKELVENSVDAGATHVTVILEGAGRTRIMISDNGCGMTKADAKLALRRHATSKITKLEDLEALSTFGFRGEALPSISAVSRMTLTTRSEDEEMGWQFVLEGGKLISEKPIAREAGTTIDVRDLFFNTPARFKFLKSDPTERAQCLRVIEEMMFSSLGVAFELKMDKDKPSVFRSFEAMPPQAMGESVKARLTEVWGARWARGLRSVFSQTPHFRLHGAVTTPVNHQSAPRYQFLFINRRPVQNRRLARAIYDAYTGQLPSLRHPGWALFLELDPSTIDVNVHPSKREVKLTHESEIFGFLSSAVKKALQGNVTAIESPVESAPLSFGASVQTYSASTSASVRELYRPSERSTPPVTAHEFPAFIQPQEAPELTDLRDPELLVLAQVRKTYIVAQTRSGLLLADQHAAAEKAAYEKLLANLKSAQPKIQMLLVPFMWETAVSVAPLVEENLELFLKMGFVVEPFGGETFMVKGLPAHLGDKFDLHSLLDGVSDELSVKTNDFQHRLAAMAACKASVKAGDILDIKACHQILRELAKCDSPFTCPHGRPTVIRLPYGELDHRFKRA